MNLVKQLLFIALPLAAMTACSEEFGFQREKPAFLEIGSDEIDFSSSAGTRTVSVDAPQGWDIHAEMPCEWFSVSKENDSSLTVSVLENREIFPREGSVSISSGNSTVCLTVTQGAFEYYFNATASLTDVGYKEGTVEVEVETNLEGWETLSSEDWLVLPEVDKVAGKTSFTASVGANQSLSERLADIDFLCGDARIGRVSITQAPVIPDITIPEGDYTYESSQFSETLTIESTYKWTASVDAAGSTWLELTLPQAGEDGFIAAGAASITIKGGNAIPAREATVSFLSGDRTFTLLVKQKGVPTTLEVDKSSLSLLWKDAEASFTITTNNAWEVTGLPEWASATPASGPGGTASVTVSCQQLNDFSREGKFTVKAGDKEMEVSISQSGGPFKKTIIFADGTTVFRQVLTPSLKESTSKANNLGKVKEVITDDPDYVMEFYSRGRTLASLTSSGLRVQVEPASGQSTSKQIRSENFAYIKFPGYEGYKMESIEVYFVTDGYAFVTSTYGSSNDEARAAAQTDTAFNAEENKTKIFVLSSPMENTPYYLFFPETNSGEIRMWNITINYTPVN